MCMSYLFVWFLSPAASVHLHLSVCVPAAALILILLAWSHQSESRYHVCLIQKTKSLSTDVKHGILPINLMYLALISHTHTHTHT